MSYKLNWYGKAIMQEFKAEVDRRMKTIGAVVASEAVRIMNVSGRSIQAAAKYGLVSNPWKAGGSLLLRVPKGGGYQGMTFGPIRSHEKLRVGKTKQVYIFRSRPGEPPHVQTGHLRRSIFWDYDPKKYSVIVGTPVKYGRLLELGTLDMKPRPWLRPALRRSIPRIQQIAGAPMKNLGPGGP